MNILTRIPVVSEHIEILPYDGPGHLIVQKELNHHIKVNDSVVNLLKLIDGEQTIDELTRVFNAKHGKQMSPEQIHDILYHTLGKYHIVKNDEHEYRVAEKPDYLKLSFTLIPKRVVGPIASFFAPLFSPSVFYSLLIIGLLVVGGFAIHYLPYFLSNVYADWRAISPVFVGAVLSGAIFFHEFGHAAACKKLGGKHGDIGVGFYLLTPVMFADVSDIWRLKRSDRIIVNLGGLFMQILLAAIFALLFQGTGQLEFLVLMYALGVLSVAFNLNPFFRTDGYWVLTDISGVSNLRATSNQILRQFAQSVQGVATFSYTRQNVLLVLYAVVSMSLIVLFLSLLLINDPSGILQFPQNVRLAITESWTSGMRWELWKPLIFPTIFYVLFIRFVRGLWQRNAQRLSDVKGQGYLKFGMSLVLGVVFGLSAIGKLIDFPSFNEKLAAYPLYFSGVSQLILGVELALSAAFTLFVFKKFTAKFSMVFLILLSLVYSYGYWVLGITECDCFGSFSFLNSENIAVVLGKNAVLVFMAWTLLQGSWKNKGTIGVLQLISLCTVALISYQVMQFGSVDNADFVKQAIGKTVSSYQLPISKIQKENSYVLLFSPTCKHCEEAIPMMHALQQRGKVVAGITYSEAAEAYEVFARELAIAFEVNKVPRTLLKSITKTVPVVLEIRNDTIVGVMDKTALQAKITNLIN